MSVRVASLSSAYGRLWLKSSKNPASALSESGGGLRAPGPQDDRQDEDERDEGRVAYCSGWKYGEPGRLTLACSSESRKKKEEKEIG